MPTPLILLYESEHPDREYVVDMPRIRGVQVCIQSDPPRDALVLDRYLEAPAQALPGTRMSFIGLRDAQQRADVIAYLETQQ